MDNVIVPYENFPGALTIEECENILDEYKFDNTDIENAIVALDNRLTEIKLGTREEW